MKTYGVTKALPKGSKSRGSLKRKTVSGLDVAERIRSARKWLGLTQAKLAARAGINATQLAHFEAGRRLPSVVNLRLLSVALNMSCDWLLGLPAMPTRQS